MAEPQNGIERKLGELIGKFDSLKERLDRDDAKRGKTYDRLDDMSVNISDIKTDVCALKVDVADMKPEVTKLRSHRFQWTGAIIVLSWFFGAGAWLLSSYVGDAVKAAINGGS